MYHFFSFISRALSLSCSVSRGGVATSLSWDNGERLRVWYGNQLLYYNPYTPRTQYTSIIYMYNVYIVDISFRMESDDKYIFKNGCKQ